MEEGIFKHYRIECSELFANADAGSVNLEMFVKQFGRPKRIAELQKQLNDLFLLGISPNKGQSAVDIMQEMSYEMNRMMYPYRYVRYGTSLFGSARLQPEDHEFQEITYVVKSVVAESKINVITGGGPGAMEAANLGLKEGAKLRTQMGKSNSALNYGVTVGLPFEEEPNEYLDYNNYHRTFGTRLDAYGDWSHSSLSWTGGAGTDFENTLVYQLKQVRHLEDDFLFLLKESFWSGLLDEKMRKMYHERKANNLRTTISPEDLKLVTYVEHPDDAVQAILNHYEAWKKRVWNKKNTFIKIQNFDKGAF